MSNDQPFDQETAKEEKTTLESVLAQVHADAHIAIKVDFPAIEKQLVVRQCDLDPEMVDVVTVDMSSGGIVHYACGIEDTDAAMRFAMVDAVERAVMAKGLQGLLS